MEIHRGVDALIFRHSAQYINASAHFWGPHSHPYKGGSPSSTNHLHYTSPHPCKPAGILVYGYLTTNILGLVCFLRDRSPALPGILLPLYCAPSHIPGLRYGAAPRPSILYHQVENKTTTTQKSLFCGSYVQL